MAGAIALQLLGGDLELSMASMPVWRTPARSVGLTASPSSAYERAFRYWPAMRKREAKAAIQRWWGRWPRSRANSAS